MPGKCSQRCTNSKGSYFCTCADGYALADDKHNCKVENRSAAYIIISNRVSMLTADLQQKSLEQIPVPVPIR